MGGKEDPTKTMEVMVQKPSLDTPELLSLDKGPTLTPHLQDYMTPTAHQGKYFTSCSPPRVECLCSDTGEANMKPTSNGDKEHAKERDSFVKEGEVEPHISVQDNAKDQNVNVEPHHTFKLAFNSNKKQGILYSLLIQEATMGSFHIKQTCTNKYDHKGFKETLWTSQDSAHTHQIRTINHMAEIMPRFIKSQGNLLNSHFYIETNLFSFYVGETVLRTKLCQGGGYDEVIQPTINQRDAEEDHMELKDQKHIISLSHSPFTPSKKTCEHYWGFTMINQSFVWRPGEILNIAPRHHTYLPKLSRYKASLPNQPMTRSRSKKIQAAFNTFVEKASQLHSFSLQPGFIPLGFTGEVFNEVVASPNGQAPPGDKPFNHQYLVFEGKAETDQHLAQIGDNKLLSLFVINKGEVSNKGSL